MIFLGIAFVGIVFVAGFFLGYRIGCSDTEWEYESRR